MIKIDGHTMMININHHDGYSVNSTRPPIHTRLDSAHPSSSSVRNQGYLCTDEIDDYRDDGDYLILDFYESKCCYLKSQLAPRSSQWGGTLAQAADVYDG